MKKGNWNIVNHLITLRIFLSSAAFLFLLVGLSSCGPKVKDLKKTSLSFNLGTTNQFLKGGVYLYGEDVLSNRFFSRGIDGGTTEIEIDLPGGRWRFFAIGWEGDNTMEGINRCASAGFDEPIFINEDRAVPIILRFSKMNCLENNAFTGNQYASSQGQFHKLKLVSCMTLNGVSSYTSNCDYPLTRIGVGQSYRVSLSGKYIPPMAFQPGLTSECISNNNITSSQYLSNLQLPFGGLVNFPLKITSYSSSNCQETNEPDKKREYEIIIENPPVNVKNSSNPLLVASNIELEKKRLIKVGDVNGTTRSHLFVPDNIFGLSKTMLNSQAPELNCQSGGSLRHCLTNASNYNTASDVYKDVKRVLQNVIGTPDGLEPDDNDNASSRKTGHLGEASWILLGPIGSSLRSYIGETCSSLPISGINLPSEGNLYTQGFDLKMRVYTPQIEIPTRISSTTSLDYRVDLYIDNNLEYAFGFRCDNQTGWMRNKSDGGDDSRSIEIFYNTADLNSSSFDFYGLELYNYEGNNYRSKTALQFKKTTADSYLGHITKTTYNLSTGSYTHVARYTVKSDISDNRMRIYHFQDEDNYPDEDNSFVTCSSDNCTSYCFTQAGDAASSGCPTISGSGDEVKTPALETIEDLSTESIDAGLGDGKEWNDLTPLTGDSSYNKAPKLNLTSKSMFVGTSYGDDNPAFDINDANTGNDFDQGNNDVTYQCEYKDTYSKTNNLASGLSAFSSSTTQTNDSLSLSKVYSVFYAHKASAIGSSTAYVRLYDDDNSSNHTNQLSTSLSNYQTVGRISILSSLSTVEKFVLTSSNSTSIDPKALYFYYKNTSTNFSDCSNIPGMTFDSNNGRFTGTPTEQNLYKVYITANNGTSKRRSSFSLSSFKNPTSFSFQDAGPTIRASGNLIGDKITLYSNSSCSSSLGSNATPNSTDGYVDIEISTPSSNTTLYYKKTTPEGMEGSCSTTGLNFVSVTAPSLYRNSSLNEYDNNTTVKIDTVIFYPNGSGSLSNVKIYKDSNCSDNNLVASLDNPTSTAHEFSIDLSSYGDGQYNFYGKSTSTQGISSACSSSGVSYNLDTVPPSSPQTSNNGQEGYLELPSYYSVPDNLTTPYVRVYNLDYKDKIKLYSDSSCSTEVSLSSANDTYFGGTYLITTANFPTNGQTVHNQPISFPIYAKRWDRHGNSSSCSSNFLTYQLDTMAPPEPTDSQVTLSNPSSSPGTDSTPTLRVDGLTAGDTVYVYNDASCGSYIGTAQVPSGETHALVTTTTLLRGSHNLKVKVKDIAGNMSDCPSSAQETYFYKLSDSLDYSYHNIGISLVYPSHTPYNVDTPKIQVTKLVAGDTVNIYTDSNCTTSTGSPYTVGSSVSGLHTSNQIPVTAISTEGNHTFYVKVTDSQGHTSSGSGVCYDSQTIPYEYDTTDPNLTNISFTRTNPTNEEGSRFYPWFKISGVPEMSEVSLWTSNDCQSGRMSNFINVSGNDHTATTDVDISTYKLNTQREWTFWVKVKERAQNTSCSSISIPYYRTPDYYGHWHPSHVRLSSSNSGGMSNNRTPQFKIDNWNYGRFIQGDTAYVYSDSNCSNLLAETTTLTESYRAVLNIPSISTDGQHEFYFRVKDSRGNLSNCPSSPQETYRLDTVAPAEPTSDDVTFVGFSSSPNIYHQPTIRVGGLSGYNSNSDYYYARVYKDNQCTQSVSGSYGGSSGATHIDISLYTLNEGTTDFYIRVYDRSGNWSNCPSSPQISYEYIKDPTNSDISFIDPSSSPSTDTTPTVRISGLGTSEVIKVYNASGCSSSNLVGTSSSSTSSGQVDITLSALNQGVNSLYFTKTKGSATTACPSSAQASYTVIPPTPTGVSLSSPTSSPGLDKNPSLTVAGITPGHTAYLYTGSNCANLVGNASLASGSSDSSVIITSSDLATGAHTFYAKAKNPQGYYSACSSASVSYEVLAEAEITSGINSTSQISIYEGNSALYGPQNAIDGDTSTYSHSDQDTTSDTKHWFTVDFGLDQQISKIKIYNRTDCCKSRLRDIDVTIHNSSGTVVYQYSLATFGNGYLNPNNVYNGTDYSPQNSGNSIHLGPDIITLNLLSSIPNGAGAPVTGSKITITRNLDPNYVANYTNWPAERNNLTISELKVYGIANVTPSVPTGLAISSPTTSTGLENNIVLTVSGVSQGNTVKVFSDNSCSQSNLKGSGTASSSNTASVNVSNLTDGSYTFYATATNSNNNASACSSASVSYHKVSWNNFGTQSWTTVWNAAETSILNTASLGTSGAATITKIGDTFGTSATKWAGGVLATNGKIYGIPWDEWKVLEIDPATGTASKMDHANITGGDKWMGGVLAPTGIIYGIPHSSSKILRIIPASGAVSTIDMTDSSTSTYLANATDTAKYSSGILAPNGKVYGIPYSATNVLVLNSITEAVSTISNTNDILTGTRKWKGGVIAPNGKIYCFPYDSENILVIDTSNDTLSTIDVTTTAGSANKKYGRGAMGPNGKIYVMPENNTHILVINTTNDSVSTLGSSLSGTYSGGVFAPNGKIYSIPRTAENILEIDATNQTVTTLLSGDSDLTLSNSNTIKWEGGILATNGKIYTIPYKADRVLEIDPKANGSFNSNIPLSPVFNKH